jgi:hypothetical protein
MLAVEDAIFALEWAKSVGGLEGLKARCTANADALGKIVAERDWLSHLAVDKGIRSKTSVCLSVEGADADFIKAMTGLLEKQARPMTSPATAMPRRACASGAARRSTPPISRRSGRGSTGPTPRPRPPDLHSPLSFRGEGWERGTPLHFLNLRAGEQDFPSPRPSPLKGRGRQP